MVGATVLSGPISYSAGETVERSYTPVSALQGSTQRTEMTQEGETIELMIKLYKDGKMSSFLSNLKEGDEVVVSDPEGTFDAPNRLAPASDILLLAAGSGKQSQNYLHYVTSLPLCPWENTVASPVLLATCLGISPA